MLHVYNHSLGGSTSTKLLYSEPGYYRLSLQKPATVLSTLAHAPESSPAWSWEHVCQEEEEEEEEE